MSPSKFTHRKGVFIEEYLQCWNASEAARRAGYKGKANVIGARLLADVSIQERINARMKAKAMQADEVLLRLTEIASGLHGQYINKDGSLDIEHLISDGKGYLIKAIKHSTKATSDYEFHDMLAALKLIGEHNQLFDDHNVLTLNLHVEGLTQLLDQVYGKLATPEHPDGGQ